MNESNNPQMKPVIVLPPDTMSKEDMDKLAGNFLCVVVAKDPALVRFLDPIPAVGGRTAIEQAAITLSRKILNNGFWQTEDTRKMICSAYLDILIKGTPLDSAPSQQEREKNIFDQEKIEELRKLAREEAKAERLAAKQGASTKK